MENKIIKICLGGEELMPISSAVKYGSAEEALASEHGPAIIIIDGWQDTNNHKSRFDLFNAASRIRSSSEFCLSPLYFSKSGGAVADQLADGVISDISQARAEADAIIERGSRIHTEKLEDSNDLRLLSFIYTRGADFVLKPLCVPFAACVYAYPQAAMLIDPALRSYRKVEDRNVTLSERELIFGRTLSDTLKWIESLTDNGYLERAGLADRIRKCPKCGAGHLNYVDSCPMCGSKNFEKKTMIHCFTCGHIAPDEDFIHNMTFVCPKCGTVLRHIGSDYDHPLESYECADCGSRFIDPDVKTECLNCGAVADTDDLIVENIYACRITEKGVNAVKVGAMQIEIKIFDGQNNVALPFFRMAAIWMVNFRQRYSDSIFSMLGLKFNHIYELSEAMGQERFVELMNTVAARLRELVRTTDVTTSSAPDTFWVLLPRTPLENCRIVEERVKQLAGLINIQGAQNIGIDARSYTLPDGITEDGLKKLMDDFSEGRTQER